MTFKEAYEALLDIAHRSNEQFIPSAKREINAACLRAARKHPFVMLQEVAPVIYPGGQSSVSLTDLLGKRFGGLISASLASGAELKVVTYAQYRAWAQEIDDASPLALRQSPVGDQTSCPITNIYGQVLVLQGANISLKPVPTNPISLVLLVSTLPEPLVGDSDTNFFLSHCWDYILLSALNRYNLYLKEDDRFPVTHAAMSEEWDGLLTWDASLRTSQGF